MQGLAGLQLEAVLILTTVLAVSLILPVFGSGQAGPSMRPDTQAPLVAGSNSNSGSEAVTAPPLIEQHIDLFGLDQSIITQSQSALLASFERDPDHAPDVELLPLAPATADTHAEPVDQLTNLEPVLATRSADTKPFTLVGITSVEPFSAGARVLVRVQEESGWSSWTPLEVSIDLPDGAEAENILYGTQPLITNSATGLKFGSTHLTELT